MVLMYHHIARKKGFYAVSAAAFSEQMQYLAENYEVVDIDTYVKTVRTKGENGHRQVAVTFDDAYESYSQLALPVIEQFKIPSALFVCTGFMGRSNEWDDPQHRYPIMDASEVERISANPLVTVGAHSQSHRPLAQLSPQQCDVELSSPKEVLEKLIGRSVNYLAYPFGQPLIDVNANVGRAAKAAGYLAAFSTNYGLVNREKDCFALHRIEVGPQDDLSSFSARFSHWQARILKQKIKNVYHILKGS